MNTFPYIGNSSIFASLEHLLSSYSKIFILLDKNTEKYCLNLLTTYLHNFHYHIISIEAGEEHKSLDSATIIWNNLLMNGADRKSILINLGGGMITDLGAFAASNFMRGIDFIQIPTTLLAQIDASVGGKTGINFQGVKNILGTFTLPKAVFICNDFLHTLSKKDLKSGYAEMLKHALIKGGNLWTEFQLLDLEEIPSLESIENSIKVKFNIVEEDFEEKGIRKILNLGHTLGHAFESLSLYKDSSPLLHGEAVALGIYYEAILAEKLGILNTNDRNIITDYIAKNYYLKTYNSTDIQHILNYIIHDKKNKNGNISFSLLENIGHATYDIFVDKECIANLLYENTNL